MLLPLLLALSLPSNPVPERPPEQVLYEALAKVETGGQANPFIRTKVRTEAGSSAYGPVQITGTLAADLLARFPGRFNAEQRWYLERFGWQAERFLKYGGRPDLPGYQKRFDYGGTGVLDTEYDRWLYRQVALIFIKILYEEQGSLEQFAYRWRGARSDSYYKKLVRALPKDFSKRY